MYRLNDDGSESFGYPAFLKVMVWFASIFFSVMAIVAAMLPVLEPGVSNLMAFLVTEAIIAPMAAASIWVARRMKERVHADDRAIVYEGPDGWLVTLPWDQVAKVVDREILQRLDLHAADGTAVLKLEYQLDHFDRLRSIVMERSKPTALGEVPSLPATFRRSTQFLVGMVVGPFTIIAFGVFSIAVGVWLGWLFLPFGLAWLFEWCAVRVDRAAITIRYPLWRRTIRLDEVDEVSSGAEVGQNYNVSLSVSLRLRGGKVRKLQSVRGGSLALYRAVAAAHESCGRGSIGEFEVS
jgi:hypothetical protein